MKRFFLNYSEAYFLGAAFAAAVSLPFYCQKSVQFISCLLVMAIALLGAYCVSIWKHFDRID